MSESEEVRRIREKMKAPLGGMPCAGRPDLPDMEKSEKTEAEMQEDAEKLRAKADDGAVGVVKKVMQQKEVQKVLKTNINKQTFISGLFMAFLLIGFLEVSQAVKEIFSYTWQFDLGAGIAMITVGAIYMVKNVVLVRDKS